MSNKTTGNQFEREFAERLFKNGFWVHRLTQNNNGQPADIIAAKQDDVFLIDCKVCSGDTFPLSRMEENQATAMEMFEDRTWFHAWFALHFEGEIYMHSFKQLRQYTKSTLNAHDILQGDTLEEWLERW